MIMMIDSGMLREDRKALIVAALQKGTCDFTYRKVDGQIREAKGTLEGSLIPQENRPKNQGHHPPEIQCYFDLNSKGWRSFRLDNLETINQESGA